MLADELYEKVIYDDLRARDLNEMHTAVTAVNGFSRPTRHDRIGSSLHHGLHAGRSGASSLADDLEPEHPVPGVRACGTASGAAVAWWTR